MSEMNEAVGVTYRDTKVAVVLSGCGVYDGSEIYEAVLTLLRLQQRGAQVSVFAPDVEQMHVVNHLSGDIAEGECRNVLVEAARIVRGDIAALGDASADNFDGLIVPGGFGAAKNLSDFAVAGAGLSVNAELLHLAQKFRDANKPIGLMCIAPAMSAAICGEGVRCTIGTDADTAGAINQTGAEHICCGVREICFDAERKLVTTPAYMLAETIEEAAQGIFALVDKVLELS